MEERELGFDEVLDAVPAFKEFMTVEELDNSSKKIAEEFSEVTLEKTGESGEGRPISCLKIGEGDRNALLFLISTFKQVNPRPMRARPREKPAYGLISMGVPTSTESHISSMALLETAMQPSVQLNRWVIHHSPPYPFF